MLPQADTKTNDQTNNQASPSAIPVRTFYRREHKCYLGDINTRTRTKNTLYSHSTLKTIKQLWDFFIRETGRERIKIINAGSTTQIESSPRYTLPKHFRIDAKWLPVITSIENDLLFNMLIASRFDYFTGGGDYVWSEEHIFSQKCFLF